MSMEMEVVTASEDGNSNSGKQGYNYFLMATFNCMELARV